MKVKINSERGQALILIAFAIIGLVAITGLAIDGGMAFSDRRHAQNAADTAALAGALAKINAQIPVAKGGPGMTELAARAPMRVAALDRAESNGYVDHIEPEKNQVEVFSCDEAGATCGAYAGDPEYLQVVITSHVDTFFAKVIGIPQVHNRVQAVARTDDDDSGPLFDGAGIVAINPECPPNGSLILGGTADITILGGGMFSNSDDECAVKCTSTSLDVTICEEMNELGVCTVPGAITTAGGGFTLSEHCDENMIGETLNTGDPIPYYAGIPVINEPEECDPVGHIPTATYGGWDNPDTGVAEAIPTTFLTPGYYGTFPPKKDGAGNQLENTLVMAPGIYCVDTVLKLVDQNLFLWGDDVTIYVRPGNGFNINGGKVQLRATHDGYYAGYLIVVAPDWDGAVTSCTLEGNALNIYEGAIFAPHCDITVNGTADTPPEGIDSQIIGYNVTISGGASLTINYDADKNPYNSDPANTGIAR